MVTQTANMDYQLESARNWLLVSVLMRQNLHRDCLIYSIQAHINTHRQACVRVPARAWVYVCVCVCIRTLKFRSCHPGVNTTDTILIILENMSFLLGSAWEIYQRCQSKPWKWIGLHKTVQNPFLLFLIIYLLNILISNKKRTEFIKLKILRRNADKYLPINKHTLLYYQPL